MKILVTGLRGFPNVQGGIETHCQHLYPRLVELGCEVTVLGRTPYIGNEPYDYNGVSIVPVVSPDKRSLETLVHTYKCSRLVNHYKPDIIHYHAIGPSFFVPFVKSKVKTVATHHGFDYDRKKWGKFAKAFLRRGENHMCKADAVISISQHISDFLISQYNKTPYLIPNGVTLPTVSTDESMCNKWGVTRKKYILFAGRFVPEKCIDDLIAAFTELDTDWKLVIAGDADHEDGYSRKIKQMGRDNPNIVLTGFISGNELHEIFSNAGAFVLPSSHEGLPIALLEALSYGLPCIASDIPSNRSVGHHSISYFPLHDIRKLTFLLNHEVSKGSARNEEEIRYFVEKNYNWNTIARQTLEVYKEILKV